MISKFTRNFCLLIFLAIIIVNIFGVEPAKRFGCHNLSSIDKITNMNGRNEIFRNLIQCMQDTNTYNEENFEIAKKLQNEFELSKKMAYTRTDGLKDTGAALGGLLSTAAMVFGVIFLIKSFFDNNHNSKKYAAAVITSPFGFYFCANNMFKREIDVLRREADYKKLTGERVKNFIDKLRKKNK